MLSLREYIAQAEEKKQAIGHFNIANTDMLWGIVHAAQALEEPVIIGTSEGEREFIGPKQAVALVRSLREEGIPVFLNADHTYSLEKVKEAIDAGYDAVIYDGTEHSMEENISITKQAVEYAKHAEHEVLIEGELGYIGKSSKMLDEIPEGASVGDKLTKPEEAKRYIEETGVDLLAPAVGTLHGMLKSGKEPALNIELVSEIREAAGVPLVLHGGSGTSDEDFKKAVEAGIGVVHVSTEIRVAYRKAIMLSLQEDTEEIAPYRYMKPAVQAVEKVVEEKIKLFTGK